MGAERANASAKVVWLHKGLETALLMVYSPILAFLPQAPVLSDDTPHSQHRLVKKKSKEIEMQT